MTATGVMRRVIHAHVANRGSSTRAPGRWKNPRRNPAWPPRQPQRRSIARGDASAGFVACAGDLDRKWPASYSLQTDAANRNAYRDCRQLSSQYANHSTAHHCAARRRDTASAIRRGNAEQLPMKMASLRQEECRFLRSHPNLSADDAATCDVC